MTAWVLVGPSGSGKSTWTADRVRTRSAGMVVCSADHHFVRPDGNYDFRPAELGEAHGGCLRLYVRAVLSDRVDAVVVDNTDTTAAEIAPYIALGLAYGARIRVLVFDPGVETCIARATHGAPEAAVRRQHAQMEAMLAAWPPHWPAWERTKETT